MFDKDSGAAIMLAIYRSITENIPVEFWYEHDTYEPARCWEFAASELIQSNAMSKEQVTGIIALLASKVDNDEVKTMFNDGFIGRLGEELDRLHRFNSLLEEICDECRHDFDCNPNGDLCALRSVGGIINAIKNAK